MSNFRTRILGLAAMATAFVGVSYGQALSCTDTTANATGGVTAPQINSALRSEGQTEQLSLLQFACTGISATSTPTTLTVTFTTNLTITSKAVAGLAGGANSEATLCVGCNAAGAGGVVTVGAGTAYQGAVVGNNVTFQGVTIPTSPAPGTITYFQVANVRVNASAAPTVPYQTSEAGLIAYTTSTTSGVTTAYTSVPATLSSGLVVTSLGAPKITGIGGPYTVCTGNGAALPGALSFTLNINQIISGAFLGLGQPPVGEGGQYSPGGGSAIGTANADIINVTLGSLPSGATVYVPQVITAGAGGNTTTLSISGSTLSAVATEGANVAYTVPASGTITIPYTVTAVAGLGAAANSNFPVATVVSFAANSTATATTVTGTYFYAPTAAALVGTSTTVPTFFGSPFPPANGVNIVLCQTTLLFPFVTNQVGFDTGIAIANTSVDNLGAAGKSFATAQSGTCNLFFYGPFAPTANAAGISTAPDPMGSLAGGNTHAFQLSGVAPGYQGYMIAVCPFNYAHAFAFLTSGITTSTGIAEGYLAEVIGTGDRGQSVVSGDAAITF